MPVRDEAHYAKAPLYMWRMSGRLVAEVADALVRGARAHEEFLVPTVCQAKLAAPPCEWRTFEPDDVGVPGGANTQDSWYMGNRPEFRARFRHNLTGMHPTPRPLLAKQASTHNLLAHNASGFQAFVDALQQPGGSQLLPESPQRIYHPVKGQLGGQTNTGVTFSRREAGGVR